MPRPTQFELGNQSSFDRTLTTEEYTQFVDLCCQRPRLTAQAILDIVNGWVVADGRSTFSIAALSRRMKLIRDDYDRADLERRMALRLKEETDMDEPEMAEFLAFLGMSKYVKEEMDRIIEYPPQRQAAVMAQISRIYKVMSSKRLQEARLRLDEQQFELEMQRVELEERRVALAEWEAQIREEERQHQRDMLDRITEEAKLPQAALDMQTILKIREQVYGIST